MERAVKAVLYGLLFIFVIIVAVGFILSLILQFSSLTEQSLQWVTAAVTFVALFVGGFIAGGKGKEAGWVLGGITGLGFVIIVFLIQFLGFNTGYELTQLLHHIAYILTATIGGVIGVNLSSKSAN
mgnify:CR=1 FL=1